MIDIHSHILPGVDDGAKTIDDSLNLIRELSSQGITDVVATPHYVADSTYVSPRDKNLKILESLKETLKSEGINTNIYLGNEIYINENIHNLVKNGQISPLNNSDYLLVELPMSGEFSNYEDILMDLMSTGYKVVLAHPERYVTFQDNFDLPSVLYDDGILLQCNLGSLMGRYGKKAKKCVKNLAKQNMVFAFGSDIHRCYGEDVFAKAQKRLRKFYNEDELRRVLIENPKKFIG